MAGYDPQLMQNALQTLRSYQQPAMSGPDMLAAQDAALAQQQADLSMASGAPVPPEQVMSAPAPPAARMPAEENQQALMSEPLMSYPAPAPQAPAPQPVASPANAGVVAGGTGFRAPSVGGGVRNPLPGMLSDATARRQQAERDMAGAELGKDVATADLQQSAEELGQSRARTAADVADVQRRVANEGDAYQQQLAEQQDSYQRASDKVQAEQRQIGEFISNYEPKDRRTMGQRVLSALAVATASMLDQVNLAAGMNMGAPVQTNNGVRAAELVQRGIDRDLQMQAAMLDNKRTALAAKGTELGQVRERFGDSMDSMRLARAMKLEQAQQQIEALKSQGMSDEALATANQTIAALEQQRQGELQALSADRFKQHYAQEQALKQAQYQQQQAARAAGAMTPERALKLEGAALDNAKKRQELSQGPGTKLTAEQQKTASFLDGYEPQARLLAQAVASGEGSPGRIERNMPDVFRSTGALSAEAAENAMIEANLRVESGASISEGDVLAKRKSTGLDSSDPRVRLAARRSLVEQYNAKRRGLGMPEVSTVVRRGAAQ